MKRNEGKYPVVNKLPKGAMTTKEYAKLHNIHESTIYQRIARGKANFEVVIFFERNFIVPLAT